MAELNNIAQPLRARRGCNHDYVRHITWPNTTAKILASETAWDALLASLPQLPPKTPRTNVVLAPKELDTFVASYAFSSDAIAKVRRKGNALEIELTGHAISSNYLSVGKPVWLTPVANDEFEIAGPREDRLHIDRDATESIVGITLNPVLWAVHAKVIREPSSVAAFQLPLCEVNEVFTDRQGS